MAETVAYLVYFPDDTKAVHDIELGRVAEVGTEILDGWVVDSIRTIDVTIDDKEIGYEVHVRPRLSH